MAKGDAAERELSNILEDQHGYAAMPAGGSGSGTTRPRPDVFAVKGVRLETPRDGLQDYSESYAVEVKARQDGCCQFTREEIEQLESFASRAGATPLVAVRPDQRSFDNWLVYRTDELNETESGNYSVRLEDHSRARTLNEVFG